MRGLEAARLLRACARPGCCRARWSPCALATTAAFSNPQPPSRAAVAITLPPSALSSALSTAAPPPKQRQLPRPHPLEDYSSLPEDARCPDLLLLDATWFATQLGRSPAAAAGRGRSHPPLAAALLRCVSSLRSAVRPARGCVAVFDGGERKRGRAGQRGAPAFLADALDAAALPALLSPSGYQADDVLAGICDALQQRPHGGGCAAPRSPTAAAASPTPTSSSLPAPAPPPLRVLIASGDGDMAALLRCGPSLRVDWLRCALYNTASHPRRLALHTRAAFVAAHGFEPALQAAAAALAGRPGDWAPGLAGVGERAAASLVRAYADPAGDPAATLAAILAAAAGGKLGRWRPEARAALVGAGAADALAASLAAVGRRPRGSLPPDDRLPRELRELLAGGAAG